MKLTGKFLGHKAGTFNPPDGDGASFPYCFAKVADEDGDGGYVKVKPASSDSSDLGEFTGVVEALAKGDVVEWTVTVDRFGNVRYLES